MALPWFSMIKNTATGLVLDVASPGGTAARIVANPSTNATSQMFMLSNGNLISLYNGLALTLPSGTAGAIASCWPESPGVAGPWSLSNGALVNSANNLVLDLASTAPGASVVANTASDASTQAWQLVPDFPLDAIIAMPPLPFPAFTGDELTAYVTLCGMVNLSVSPDGLTGGVRGAYDNINKDPAALQNQIDGLACPSEIPATTWAAVVDQLSYELGMVADVHAVYANLSSWYSAVFLDNGLKLAGLIAESQVNTNAVITWSPFALFTGLLYTAMSAAGPAWAVAANLTITALNTANSVQSLEQTFTAQVGSLWNSLSATFLQVQTAIGNNFTAIMQDWGKIQAVETLVNTGVLDLTPAEQAAMIEQTSKAYSVTVLKVLMPLKWQIYRASQVGSADYFAAQESWYGDIPSWATWTMRLGNGRYTSYFVGASGGAFSSYTYPSEQCMREIFGNGVSVRDFYNNAEHWPFQTNEVWMNDGQSLLVTIYNTTGIALGVSATAVNGEGEILGTPRLRMEPWGSMARFLSYYSVRNSGNCILYSIVDLATQTVLASFQAHQSWAYAIGATPWIDNVSVTSPFTLSTPIIEKSAMTNFSKGHPGMITLSIGPLGAVTVTTQAEAAIAATIAVPAHAEGVESASSS